MNQKITEIKVTPKMRATITASESLQWTMSDTILGTTMLLAEGVSIFGTLILTKVF